MAKLKVYGFWIFHDGKQVRAIVATTSWRRAAELANVTIGHAQMYGAITGNAQELALANAVPDTVFIRPLNSYGNDPFKVL
jgi:hypothetical protein